MWQEHVIISCAIFALVLVVLAESFVICIALHLFILAFASSESPPINTDQLQTRLQTSDCDRGSSLSGSPIRGLDTKSVDVVGRGSFANVKSCECLWCVHVYHSVHVAIFTTYYHHHLYEY